MELLKNMDYKLSSAMLVYQCGQKDYYLETCKIDKDGRLSEKKPLTRNSIKSIVETFYEKEEKTISILPTNLLFLNRDIIIWHTPSMQRELFFDIESIPDGIACIPAMLWIINNSKLSVFALKTNARPTLDTKIFKAPFHNIYMDGSVCMGTAMHPERKIDTDINKLIIKWELSFWHSRFSHLIDKSPVKDGYNINLIWKNLIESGDKFPKEVLENFKYKTVKELFESL